jgi:hypothetical protein
MRRFWSALAVVAFLCTSTRADSILDVNAWATFAAMQPCYSNCTETINTSFQYYPISVEHSIGGIVPGTLDLSSSGFLGSFSVGQFGGEYISFFNSMGDEIDLEIPMNPFYPAGLQPGVNTVGFYLWACQSQTCGNAYGETWIVQGPGQPTSRGSMAAPISTSEPPTWFLLVLGAALLSLVMKWKTLLH